MRVALLQSGQVRFVNEVRRKEIMDEQGFQAANSTPGQNAAVGKQLGVKYMLTGSFSKIEKKSGRQVRVSKKYFSFYKLTMEVTDIETGEIVWIAEHEIAREARKPLIGW
jgi:PBP1b-binding outer membrane lipoprotein LpoB